MLRLTTFDCLFRESTDCLDLFLPGLEPELGSYFLDNRKRKYFLVPLQKLPSFKKISPPRNNIILYILQYSHIERITFKQHSIRQIKVNKTYKCCILYIKFDLLENCSFCFLVLLLRIRFICIPLVSIEIRNSFV